MNIQGSTQHKILKRPWGAECQFTVERKGRHINAVVPISNGADATEAESAITAHLEIAMQPPEDAIPSGVETATDVAAVAARDYQANLAFPRLFGGIAYVSIP